MAVTEGLHHLIGGSSGLRYFLLCFDVHEKHQMWQTWPIFHLAWVLPSNIVFTSDEAQRLTHYFLISTNSGSSCWIEQLEGKERINCVLFGSKIDLDETFVFLRLRQQRRRRRRRRYCFSNWTWIMALCSWYNAKFVYLRVKQTWNKSC